MWSVLCPTGADLSSRVGHLFAKFKYHKNFEKPEDFFRNDLMI